MSELRFIPEGKEGYSEMGAIPSGSGGYGDRRSFKDSAEVLKFLDALSPSVESRAEWVMQLAHRAAFQVFVVDGRAMSSNLFAASSL
jgi:hypothetical protein